MNHEEIQDLLEDYVDDRLDRQTRKVVDDHLKECAECRQILDEVAPVDISVLGPRAYDERAMRRTVRRSLLRTAWNTVLLILAGWIAIWFFAALVIQPFVVSRDGRAAAAARASIDLAIMLTPGAVLTDGAISSGLLDRQIEFDFGVPVGAGMQRAIRTSTSLGLFGIREESVGLTDDTEYGRFQGEAGDQLSNLGEATVATVSLFFDDPLSMERAQAIADDPDLDFRVVWAGFDASLGRVEPPAWTAGGVVGYGTCQLPTFELDDDLLSASSAGFSQGLGFIFGNASIEAARDSVVAALANISSRGELAEHVTKPFGDPEDIDEILAALTSEPSVAMLVVTGPSNAIADYLTTETGLTGTVLAVDFYNWTTGICGR